MNTVRFDVACEARYAPGRACAPLSAVRRSADHFAILRAEVHRHAQPDLTDEAFRASDVALHRAPVDGAGNPLLSYQLAGAAEKMQPLMNMITVTARSREAIETLHTEVADALEARDAARTDAALVKLEASTRELVYTVATTRSRNRE